MPTSQRFVVILCGLSMVGCASDVPTSATTPSNDSGTSSTTPMITSIDGHHLTNPAVIDQGNHYYDSLSVDYYPAYPTPLTISGSGFGQAKGRIVLSDPHFLVGDESCIVWTNTAITFCPTILLDATPIHLTLTVVTASGTSSNAYPHFIVPTIASRVYGQCTWWVARRDIEQFGKNEEPQPGAYPQPSSQHPSALPFDVNYVPRQYDAWLATGKHQAFVESVVLQVDSVNMKITTVYTANLSEYNVGNDEQYSTYPSTVTFVQPYDPVTGNVTGPRYLSGLVNFSSIAAMHPDVVWRIGR